MDSLKGEYSRAINIFLEERRADTRDSSFDYCYEYFQTTETLAGENLQLSCLQLGFYLASWGMYRGSSKLLKEKSVRVLVCLIEMFCKWKNKAHEFHSIWKIDVDKYTDKNISTIVNCYEAINKALKKAEINTYRTLTTKIMLGVFGCVPAFDENFTKFFKKNICIHNKNSKNDGRCNSLHKDSLDDIAQFYNENPEIGNGKIKIISFITGKEGCLCYPKARIIDMIGFEIGKTME